MTEKCYAVNVTEKYYSVRIEVNKESDFGKVHWTSPGKATHVYEGNILNNCLHGNGIYEWLDHGIKRVYEGNFYINNIEGYGRFSYPDGSLFQGLFRKNKKYGPGVHTQVNGNEDVGLWDGSNLMKIITCASSSVPCLAPTPEGRVKLLCYRKLIEISEDSCDLLLELKQLKENIRNYQTFYSDSMKKVKNLSSGRILYNERLNEILGHFEKLEINVKKVELENEYLNGTEMEPQLTHLVAWNNSDDLIDMLQYVFKYRQFEHLVSFRIDHLLRGRRNKFKPPGEHETKCYDLLIACGFGDRKKVAEILEDFQINPNVSDCSGNSGLVIASANDAHVTIDVLLKYRANINHFNDEGLTPVSLCLLRYLAVKYKVKLWEKAFLPVLSKEKLNLEDYLSNGLWRQRKLSSDTIESVNPLIDEEFECIVDEVHIEETTANLKTKLNFETSHYYEQLNTTENESFRVAEDNDNQIYSSIVEKLNNESPVTECQVSEESSEDIEPGRCVFQLSPMLINVLEYSKLALELETAKQKKNVQEKKVMSQDFTKEPCKPSKSKLLKLSCIKRTIMKLIRRGANPNITEVPLPSIFLAVFTEDPEIVLAILTVTENPSQKYPLPDGIITPIHIISMYPPSQEMVKICELLLKFGADPNIKTEEEDDDIDEEVEEKCEGKTALQILCLREEDNQDMCEYQCTVTKLLVKYGADTNVLYMDYSPLSSVMLQGKMKLFTTLLETKRVNPNQKLGGYGVPLTYLLSEKSMAHIPMEKRIEMSELLLKHGADPLVDLKHMSDFEGNVIDFGMLQLHQMKTEKKKGSEDFEKLLKPIIKVGTENVRRHVHGKIIKSILKANEKRGMNKYKSMLIAIPISLKQGLFCMRMCALSNKKSISHEEISNVLKLMEIKESKMKNILNKELKVLSNLHKTDDDFGTEQEMLKIDDFNIQAIKSYYSKPYIMPLLMIASDMIELACLPPVEAQDADGVLTYFHWLHVHKSSDMDVKKFEKGDMDFFSEKQHLAEDVTKKVKKYSSKDILQQGKTSWMIIPETDRDENKYKVCFQCGQKMKHLTECSSCKMVAFCSEKCMRAAADCNTHTCITTDFDLDKISKKTKKGKGDESERSRKTKGEESRRSRKVKENESGRSDRVGKKGRDKSKKSDKDKSSKRKAKSKTEKSKRKKGKDASKYKKSERSHARKGKKKGMGVKKKIHKKQKSPYFKQKRFPKEYLHYFLMQALRDGAFDLNMFLLPYTVLRDGSLFYHVYGPRPECIENYSYI